MNNVQSRDNKRREKNRENLIHSSLSMINVFARDLGIADGTLHHWCKEFAKAGEHAFPGSGYPPASEEELRRLRREVEILRQERGILKKHWPSFRAARSNVSVYRRTRAAVSGKYLVSRVGSEREWLL